jgi:1,4-dihydroxy-2-naphthoate octaprenyltransferase
LFFGLVATVGSYFLQTGRFAWAPAAAGAMIGALAAAVLVVNNYRDLESDRRSGKITLAVRIGYAATRIEFAVLVLLPFAALPLLGALTGSGARMLLPVAALPIAVFLMRDLARAPISPALNPLLKRRPGSNRLRLAGVCGAGALTMKLVVLAKAKPWLIWAVRG